MKKQLTPLTDEEADRILEAKTVYRYDSEWNIAICTHCQYAVPGDSLADHAVSKHRIFYKDYHLPVQALYIKSIVMSIVDFPRPSNDAPPIPGLKMINGFGCSLCNFLTKNKDYMRKHGRKHPGITDYTRLVKLQVSIKSFFFYLVLIYRHGTEMERGVEMLIQFIGLSMMSLLRFLRRYQIHHGKKNS
jgi:Orsellinic acid/F9775 biosynthesis cluster protein D